MIKAVIEILAIAAALTIGYVTILVFVVIILDVFLKLKGF